MKSKIHSIKDEFASAIPPPVTSSIAGLAAPSESPPPPYKEFATPPRSTHFISTPRRGTTSPAATSGEVNSLKQQLSSALSIKSRLEKELKMAQKEKSQAMAMLRQAERGEREASKRGSAVRPIPSPPEPTMHDAHSAKVESGTHSAMILLTVLCDAGGHEPEGAPRRGRVRQGSDRGHGQVV